jgi:phage head maturation protease
MDLEFLQDEADTVCRAIPTDGDGLSWLARAAGEDDDGLSRFIASSGDIDRHGDSVEQSWRLKNWRANPVILAGHNHDLVVGRGAASIAKDDAPHLALSVAWDESELNPIGQLVAHQHRAGFRHAVSVGFRPGETTSRTKLAKDDPRYVDGEKVPEWRAGHVFRFPELLEVSSVGVPANPKALQVREFAASAEDPEEQVRRFLRETTGPKLRAILHDAMKANKALATMVRALTVGAATPTPTETPLAFLER